MTFRKQNFATIKSLTSTDFLKFCIQATEEKKEMEQLREYNKKLLFNILPSHVAGHFLATEKKNEVI